MKTLAALLFSSFFLTSGSIALADSGSVLRNSDFSEGVTEWEGDAHTPDSTSFDDPTITPPTSGLVVKLRHGEWTKVTQDFDGDIGQYNLTVTYAVSANLSFSTKQEDYVNIPSLLNFNNLMPFSSMPGNWVVIVNDLGAMHYTYWKIVPKLDGSGTQTFTAQIQLDSPAAQKKGFYLCFPPGNGYINLLGISLTPQGGTSH
jgi:hypothetical protein